jgi:hypothetical protein
MAGGAAQAEGIWLSRDEIRSLPMSGEAWTLVKTAADTPIGRPALWDISDTSDVLTLAKALVYVRTGEARYREDVIANCLAAIGTETGGVSLGLARNLASYVIAADLVGLKGTAEVQFRAWLRKALTENLGGRTLQSTHEDRPNNWGTMAGASRAAVAAYLGDQAELARTAEVFKGWLGDRTSYAGFKYGELSWQADPSKPVGINPKGAIKNGINIDGALPEEMRRGGPFQWPPVETGYTWEALQGAVVQAELLHRQGYPAYQWQERAIRRSVEFLDRIGWSPTGDDQWIVWVINQRYGTKLPTNSKSRPGKIMGWTSWTHGATQPAERHRHVPLAPSG